MASTTRYSQCLTRPMVLNLLSRSRSTSTSLLASSRAQPGQQADAAVPLITYVLGGKANNGPGLYQPSWKDIAPRVAFAFNPSWDRRTVFNGGAGIVYDRTIVNAVQYQQDQSSYLFQQNPCLHQMALRETRLLRLRPIPGSVRATRLLALAFLALLAFLAPPPLPPTGLHTSRL